MRQPAQADRPGDAQLPQLDQRPPQGPRGRRLDRVLVPRDAHLPYIEQAPLYNTVNFAFTLSPAAPGTGNINSTAIETKLNAWICPSDLDRLANTAEGHNNYVMNCGSDAIASEGPTQFVGIGVSLYTSGPGAISIASVIDGTSNTAAYSEINKGVGDVNMNPLADNLIPTSAITLTSGFNGTPANDYQICKAANAVIGTTNMSTDWPFGVMWHSAQRSNGHYRHVMPPNTWSCQSTTSLANGAGNFNFGAFTASSRHSGGVNVLMLDGSVRFTKSTINPITWWALGTRQGNEVISADAQ